MRPNHALCLAVAVGLLLHAGPADATTFDPKGYAAFEPNAVAVESFEELPSWSSDPPPGAIENMYVLPAADALEGHQVGAVQPQNWWERVRLPVLMPPIADSYSASLWVRSGAVRAVFVARYESRTSKRVLVDLSPTGRLTSDGWIEMASAPFSLDGTDVSEAYFDLQGTAQVDAVEIVPAGTYQEEVPCFGISDPVCGDEAVCIDEVCRLGEPLVPLLPAPAERDRVVDLLRTRIDYFFGGYRTRRDHLPAALAEIEQMRSATTAWQFWGHFARAVRRLGDWHTSASGLIGSIRSSRRLNVCFIEGDADLSHAQWPPDPRYLDVLVSHVGPDRTSGLRPGDRLVAVDGIHPIAWARSLIDVSWDWWRADDDTVNAEFVERMRGLIP
ncbi:MAG: hypothetical protein ACOC1F_05040, partial [Myxococcota bacterium]